LALGNKKDLPVRWGPPELVARVVQKKENLGPPVLGGEPGRGRVPEEKSLPVRD